MAKAKKAQIVDPSEVLETNSDDLKKYIRIAVFFIIVAVGGSAGIAIMKKQQQAQIEEQAAVIFEFKNGAFKEFSEEKMTEAEIIEQAKGTISDLEDTASFFPVSSDLFTKFRERKLDMTPLIPVFESLKKGTSEKNIAYYYYSNYLAVIHEDAKNYTEALTALKGLVDSPVKYEEKLYVDLGRLSYLSGDKAAALTNFNHVIDKFPDSEMAKLAKRYTVNYELETPNQEEAKPNEN